MAALLVFGVAAGACGGGGNKAASTGTTKSDAPTAATTGSGGTSSAASGKGKYRNCPVTAEQVSSVIGRPMKVEELSIGCQFQPATGELQPAVGYVPQSSILADASARKDVGYVRAVPGVADEAYGADTSLFGSGVTVAARDGNQWFEVSVDTAADNATDEGLAAKVATIIADNN